MPRRISRLAEQSGDRLDAVQTIVFALFAMAFTVGVPAWIHSTVKKFYSPQRRQQQRWGSYYRGISGGDWGAFIPLTAAAIAAALLAWRILASWRPAQVSAAGAGSAEGRNAPDQTMRKKGLPRPLMLKSHK